MSKATYDQAAAIHSLLAGTPREQLQIMLARGLLADLRDGDLEHVDRNEFRRVLRLKPRNAPAHVIDLDARPFVPEGWEVRPEDQLPNAAKGQLVWDVSKMQLHLDDAQKNGGVIEGDKLCKKLAELGDALLNANVLDWLLAHPEEIPESWRGKEVFFWGTIYRRSSGYLCVRYLYWGGSRWYWSYFWLDSRWNGSNPAAVLGE
jgi:hypothetical protein